LGWAGRGTLWCYSTDVLEGEYEYEFDYQCKVCGEWDIELDRKSGTWNMSFKEQNLGGEYEYKDPRFEMFI
jgi:hypothetical protein